MLLPRLDTIIWSFFEEEEARSFRSFIEERGYPAQLVDLDDPRYSSEPGFMTKTGVLVDGRDQHLIKRHLLTWLAVHVKTVNVRDYPKLPDFESVNAYHQSHQPISSAPPSAVRERATVVEEFPVIQMVAQMQKPGWQALRMKYARSFRLAIGIGATITGFWLHGAWILSIFLASEYALNTFLSRG